MKSFIFLSFLLSQSAWSISTSEAIKVQELVTETILKKQETENAGVSVSVFNKKDIVFQSGFGYANSAEKRPVTTKTAFAIGSTTKAFTALSVKLLENQGLLKITDRVLDHLTDFKLSNEAITEQVTIEDLLSHRIGLPRHDLMWLFSNFDRNENYHRLQYLAFPENAEDNFRKKFVYNNFMFMVAGKIIEAKTHDTYENFVQENIFKPLQMNETSVTVPQNHADLADPYFKTTIAPHRDISDMAPAGSFYSTSGDMTKWIQSLMNKKWENQDDLFRARIGLNNKEPDLKYGYGLAWMTNTINKEYTWYFHDGNIDGFSTAVLFSPELDLGVVVLVNQNGSGIGDYIIESLLKYEIAKRPINKSFVKRAPIKLTNVDIAYDLRTSNKALARENEKSFENSGYGVMSAFQAAGKTYIDYYGNIWETKTYDHDYFNIMADMVFGAEHFEFPMKLTNEIIVAPFQEGVPMIEFSEF